MQVTVVSPVENEEPAAGEQVVVSGGEPPDADGGGNWTAPGAPSGDSAATAAGHMIAGPLAGPVGE